MGKNKEIKTYWCTIQVAIFKTAVLVLVTDDMENVYEDLPIIYKELEIPKDQCYNDIFEIRKQCENDKYMPPGAVYSFPYNDDLFVIYKGKNMSEISKELICHETHHLAHFLLNDRGVCDEECEAYLQEYLFNQTLCKIDDWNNKHKKKKR